MSMARHFFRISHTLLRLLLAIVCGLALSPVAEGKVSGVQSKAPRSVAFWYAADAPLPELAQFDWVVLEPGHTSAEDVAFLRGQGSAPFAYVSVGEFYGDLAALGAGASTVRNQAWDSQVMDLRSRVWRNHLLKHVRGLAEQGYSGLFLDTLDSFQLQPEAARPAQRDALVSLIRELHRRHPRLKLFFNRGFEIHAQLKGVPVAVAVESIHAGWHAGSGEYRPVPQADRDWLEQQFAPLRAQGIPLVAIDYLPPERRKEARRLARRLQREGFVPVVTTPGLDSLGVSGIEVQPRRIAMLYDPRQDLQLGVGHRNLGGLLEYLGYRVDYLPVDADLPQRPTTGLYAGVVTWLGGDLHEYAAPVRQWLGARLDERTPLAFLGGLWLADAALLRRLGLRRADGPPRGQLQLRWHDPALLGRFEAPLVLRRRGLELLQQSDMQLQPGLLLVDEAGEQYLPVGIGSWGGFALTPYVIEDGRKSPRWLLDPFTFLQRALRLPSLPRPDATTENGQRIATVHIDGDGFPSRVEVAGAPYAGRQVLDDFIARYPLLTSASVIEGEIGAQGMYPHLAPELERIAREMFAHPRVEVATHSFSHPFFWQLEVLQERENFDAPYGYRLAIPHYDIVDLEREITGSRDYINARLTTPDKPVKLMFWTGDALPSGDTVKLAYDAGLLNVNGGLTVPTRANPSLLQIEPLLRPTSGGLHYYAPIINENVYTNLWQGPYYGFRELIGTLEITDSPRRMRGLHLYYHFYAGTKQASIRAMHEIYRYILAQQPLSLWMSDYLTRVHGLYQASLARRMDGRWQLRGLDGLRTLRLDEALGWPDLARSHGVAGVRDLPQGRYVHLSSATPVLALRAERDPRPALEFANLPLTDWHYLGERHIRFGFAGEFPLRMSVRSASACRVEVQGSRFMGRGENDLWHFELPLRRVSDARLLCD